MSKIITLTLSIIFLTLMISGCYTILQHPASETNYTAEDYQADCLGCHADYHEYPYGYFYGNYPDYWWSNPRWGQYYAYPWWWDNYWYDNNNQHTQKIEDDSPSLRSTSGKKVERRDTLRPPYSVGTTNISRSGGSSGNTGASGSTSTPSDQGKQPADNPDNTKVKETKEEEKKKEDKKAPRRGGGRSR